MSYKFPIWKYFLNGWKAMKIEILLSYIFPIIAILGGIPGIIMIYKNYIQRPRLDVFEAAFLEIGFDNLGPTIELMGTLNATNRDVFIKSIDLVVTRNDDNLTHNFNWFAFKTKKFMRDENYELPYSFLVTTSSPHRYCIQFHDEDTYQKIINQRYYLNSIWHELYNSKDNQELTNNIISTYEERSANIKSDIDRLLYWEEGEYNIRLIINTKYPDKVLEQVYKFNLTKFDAQKLRMNVKHFIDEPVKQAFQDYNYLFDKVITKYQN